MSGEKPFETIPYRDYVIEVYPDLNPESPREWSSNLGTMVCWHRRYHLGDDHDFRMPEDFQEWRKGAGVAIAFPLYLLDHSGLRINVKGFDGCDPHRWDWGWVGWVYVTRAKLRENYRKKRVSQMMISRATRVLLAEVQEYDWFLSGAVYGYVAKTKFGDKVDSCWGFYGYDHERNGLLEMAHGAIDYALMERRG